MFRNQLSTHLAGLVRPARIAKTVRPAQLISRRGIATQPGLGSAGSAAEQARWRGGAASGAGRLTVLGAAAAGVLAVSRSLHTLTSDLCFVSPGLNLLTGLM